MFNFDTAKIKNTTDATMLANALNGLKPYIKSYASLKTGTGTQTNYYALLATKFA